MVENEQTYLATPEKMEYPNETWAAQDFRKTNVLLYASKYSEIGSKNKFIEKAEQVYIEAIEQLLEFDTNQLTRPIALLMQNGMMFSCFKTNSVDFNRSRFTSTRNKGAELTKKKNWDNFFRKLSTFSPRNELQFIRWRLK